MNKYKSSAELKGMAKEQLFGNYGTAVSASLIITLFRIIMIFLPALMINTTSIAGLIIYYLVSFILSLFTGIFTSGSSFFYLKLSCRQRVTVGDIFFGFRMHPDKAILLQLVLALSGYICTAPMLIFNYLFAQTQNIIYMLLTSVFTIIGYVLTIIISLMLSQVFFLLQDFPQYSAKELLKMSRQIMKGHKGRLFYISLSFVPLFLLGLFSCCIAYLWIIPYINAVLANFYMDLMQHRNTVQ